MDKSGKFSKDSLLMGHLFGKLCHDMAGVIGAINNGVEFMEDSNIALREHANVILKQSTKELVVKLKFFRKLYSHSDEIIRDNLLELLDLAKQYLEIYEVELIYEAENLKSFSSSISDNYAKMIINLLYSVSKSVMGKGQVIFLAEKDGKSSIIKLLGDNLKISKSLEIILENNFDIIVDSKTAYPLYNIKLLSENQSLFTLAEEKEGEMTFFLKKN